jgi:hypothetical protein
MSDTFWHPLLVTPTKTRAADKKNSQAGRAENDFLDVGLDRYML